MKKTGNLTVIISTILVVIGVIATSFFTDYSDVVSSVVTTVTAVIGAVALFIQFKKDKQVNQASFMVNFYETFYNSQDNIDILDILDEHTNGNITSNLTDKKYYKKIMSYMGWIRTLCSFIDNKVLDFNQIDDIYSYKFFAFVNNKQIQLAELGKNRQFYNLIYRVHKKWSAYKKKYNKPIILEESSLSLIKDYDVLAQ